MDCFENVIKPYSLRPWHAASAAKHRAVDLSRRFFQKPSGQDFKLLGKIGQVKVEAAVPSLRRKQAESSELFFQMLRAGRRRVHKPHIPGQQLAQHRNEQRIMRAGQHQGINSFFNQWLQIRR
jgi:hypothetical protein